MRHDAVRAVCDDSLPDVQCLPRRADPGTCASPIPPPPPPPPPPPFPCHPPPFPITVLVRTAVARQLVLIYFAGCVWVPQKIYHLDGLVPGSSGSSPRTPLRTLVAAATPAELRARGAFRPIRQGDTAHEKEDADSSVAEPSKVPVPHVSHPAGPPSARLVALHAVCAAVQGRF